MWVWRSGIAAAVYHHFDGNLGVDDDNVDHIFVLKTPCLVTTRTTSKCGWFISDHPDTQSS